MKRAALIMAGGKGERFWPKSRRNMPKQFLSLTGDGKTMIQLTVERIAPLVNIEDTFIVTNSLYKDIVKEQLPMLPEENILCEPVARNTAPCIGLGAFHMASKYKEATMIVLPSDHLIKDQETFLQVLRDGCEIAQRGRNLVTIGITPNYPETGYGYIQYDRNSKYRNGYCVRRFVEKPNAELARQYVESGGYLWNSGMFVWNISTIMEELKDHIPQTYANLLKIGHSIGTMEYEEALKENFAKCESKSIDYAIMEVAQNVYSIPGNFGWDDVGSWLALERYKQSDQDGNIRSGNVMVLDTKDCIIEGTKRLIAAVGVKDIIVVDTEDCLLICGKEQCGKIKEILKDVDEQLK